MWQSPEDSSPIRATFDLQTKRWEIVPPDKAESWRPILSRVALGYDKNADLKQLSTEQLWTFALTKLRNEYNLVRWARERRPSVEIYLLPIDHQRSQVAFIYGNAPSPLRTTADFTRDRNGTWIKGKESLDLRQLLGVPDDPKELNDIFALKQTRANPDVSVNWKAAWNSWITDFQTGPATRNFMYRDAQGQLRWVWQERLNAGDQMPTAYKAAPLAPSKIPDVGLYAPVVPAEPTRSWPTLVLVLAALTGGLIIVGVVFRKRLQAFASYLPSLGRGRRILKTDSEVVQSLIPEENLRTIHSFAIQDVKTRFTDEETRRVLVASLEWGLVQYLAVARNKSLLLDEDLYRTQIVDDYLVEQLKLPAGTNPSRVIEWIQLGKATETAVSEVDDLRVPSEIQSRIASEKTVQKWTKDDWASQWPSLLFAFEASLTEAKQRRDHFETTLTESRTSHEKEVLEKEQQLNERWQARFDEVQRQNSTYNKLQAQAQLDLQYERTTVNELRNEGNKLRTELATLQSEKEITAGANKDFRAKLDQLNDLKRLSRELRRWLQGYYAGRMNDSRESRGIAVISALINFSISQMCFSIIEDLPSLRTAIAQNILVLAKAFDQPYGLASDFDQARKYLQQITPNIEKEKLNESELGGDTLDDPLFRGFLYWLKSDTGKNVSPFFLDIDRKKNTLVFVTTS